jgi:hypothetical protein
MFPQNLWNFYNSPQFWLKSLNGHSKKAYQFIIINEHWNLNSNRKRKQDLREREREKERITSSSCPTKSSWFPAFGDYWRREWINFVLLGGKRGPLGFLPSVITEKENGEILYCCEGRGTRVWKGRRGVGLLGVGVGVGPLALLFF